MGLNRERITLNPYEESSTNIPLELGGDRWGHGIFIQPKGSQWPTAQITPQLAQSVDTEGGLAAATQVGFRDITLKLHVVEPTDGAATNYVITPQPGNPVTGAGTGLSQNAATGGTIIVPIRDLAGVDYSVFEQCPGTNASEGLTSGVTIANSGSPNTLGWWLKGAVGGEAVTLALGSSTTNITLTTSWRWYTVTNPNPGTTTPAAKVTATTTTALSFYAAGYGVIDGSAFAEYFDGTYPGCSWTGAPFSSTSVRPTSGGPRLNAIMADVERQVERISRYRSGTVRRITPNQAATNTRATYDLVGAELTWDDTSMMNAGVAQGTLTLKAQPYARGPEITTTSDAFSVFVPGNYTMDSGLSSDFSAGGSGLSASSNLGTEHRFIYTGGTYPLHSGEVSAQLTPGATLTGWKGGAIIARYSSNTYVEAYVTDNGTSSILNVDKVVSGTRTNLGTTTLAARVANGTSYVVRVRTEQRNLNTFVFAEYFASASYPVSATAAPTASLGPIAITELQFSPLQGNVGGAVITPQTAGAALNQLALAPYLARERSLPVLRFDLCGVPGTAPALGRMIVQDDSGNDQYSMRWGICHARLATSTTTDLFFEAESLSLGTGSTTATVVGASGGSAVKSVSPLLSQPVPILSTGSLGHVGTYQVYARVQAPSPMFLQLRWTTGDFASWTANNAIQPVAFNSAQGGVSSRWVVVDLGTVRVPPSTTGAQQWQGVINAWAPTGAIQAIVDCLWLVPLDDGAGTVRGTPTQALTFLTYADRFGTSSAALSGLAATLGGSWATSGATTDFTENSASANVTRATVSDTGSRYAVIGSASAQQWAMVNFSTSAIPTAGTILCGLVLRWTSSSSLLVVQANIGPSGTSYISAAASGDANWTPQYPYAFVPGVTYQLYANVDADGRCNVYFGTPGSLSLVITGWSSSLATGGAQASGQVGFVDSAQTTTASTRTYSNFQSGSLTPTDAAFYAGKQIEIRSDRANRQDANATLWTPPSSYTGSYLKVPNPIYDDGVARVLVKASRNDLNGSLPDPGIDAVEAQINITPRYAQIPDA